MFRRKQSSTSSVVGLELDPGHLAAAEVRVNGSLTLTRGAVAPLRRGVVRDGEIADPAALGEALRALWDEHELPKAVRVGIAHQRIVVRTLDLLAVDDPKALAAAVEAEAPDHLPMPMSEAIVDFQPLGIVETLQGPRQRVVVVAVRRETVDKLLGATRAAGLDVVGVDLAAFGMIRALGAESDGAGLYVNVAGLTNVAVADERGGCLFTRAAAGGLDALVQTLAERRGLTAEHSQQWLTHVGLVAPLDAVEGEAELVAAARTVLEEGVLQLADTVRNSLNFYRTQQDSQPVRRGYVTGPAVAIPGLVEALGEQLRLPLEARLLEADEGVEADLGRLTVAAGLAVAEHA